MKTQETPNPFHTDVTDSLSISTGTFDSPSPVEIQELERQVEYIVDDCFFTVGQVVGMRTTVDYEAVIWWRDHYREKFLAAMMAFGNRWMEDRSNVTSVAIMLAERAVRYSRASRRSTPRQHAGPQPTSNATVNCTRVAPLADKGRTPRTRRFRVSRATGAPIPDRPTQSLLS